MLQYAQHFLIVSFLFELCISFPGNFLGPGFFIFQSFEHCDPPVTEIDIWIRYRKYNRTINVFDLDLNTPWPLDDNIIMDVKTATKKDGGYKPGSFSLKGPFCSTLKKIVGDLFYAIADATGVEDCPLPGSVNLTNFYADNDKLSNQVIYGDYKAEVNFILDNEVKGCYVLYFNVVPKE